MRTEVVDINGSKIHYELTGSGPCLVLIHGFALDLRLWDLQIELFSKDFKLLRYDLRGFGKSALPTNEAYSHTADLKALLDHVGISHTHLLGLSLGGMIAIDFALEYPGVADSMILAGAYLGGFQFHKFGRSLASVWIKAKRTDIQAAKETWLSLDLFKPTMDKPKVASRLMEMVSDYSGWHFDKREPYPTLDPPAIERLDSIYLPTLVIVGEHDLEDFHNISNILEDQIPKARKVVLPDVGHLSNMENPEIFNQIVLDFLNI